MKHRLRANRDDGEEDLYHVLKDKNIEEKLMSERAGIFNWCLAGANRLIKNKGKFTETEEQAEISTAFITANEAESVNQFVDAMLKDASEWKGKTIKKADIFAHYAVFCANNDIEAECSNRKFYGAFEVRLKAKEIQLRLWQQHNGERVYSF